MTDEQEHPTEDGAERGHVMRPPRAFDDEAEPEAPASGDGADDESDDEPAAEVVAEDVEPEAAGAFESLDELPGLLEALLFVADHPIDVPYLSRAVEVSQARVERALDELAESLRAEGRGVRLQRGPEGVQLVSAPEAAAFIERFLGLEASRRLSTAALETLAIIAYRQPITRGQIDAIRGVSSDGAVATLRARDLIEAAGHAPGPGRPMLFRTTQRFLEHFGLERPGQLPPLPEDIDLPPAEIGQQLGLDEAEIAEALKPREPEAAEDEGDAADDEPGAPDAPGEAADSAGTGTSDVQAAKGDEVDEIVRAVTASEISGVEISSDVQALSAAAEQAFSASRDREGYTEPESTDERGEG